MCVCVCVWLVGWLVGRIFYVILTDIGYLMLNHIYIYIYIYMCVCVCVCVCVVGWLVGW